MDVVDNCYYEMRRYRNLVSYYFEDVFHCLIIKDLCCSDSDQLIYFTTELFVCQELF